MKYICICILLFTIPIAFGQSIHTKIDQLLQEQKLVGAVYTIVDHHDISCFASGLKNLKTGEKLDKNTKVNVGSITKTLLALGILRLATEKKLHIDDPIKKYLPDLPINNPWEQSQTVTIRHLLDHTSGLSDIRLWHFFSTSCSPQTELSEFYTRSPEVLTIEAKPGTVFSYSNMGYTLLGILIESVVKERYEDYLDKNLLQPIGLKNSTFHFISQHEHKDLAMGHFDNGSMAPAMPTYVRPAGQFTTTALDMGILLQFILDRGKLQQEVFIASEYIDMLGVPNTVASQNGLTYGYAFGALSRDRHGVVGLAHSGNTVGFRAMYQLFPGQNKAYFIAHNMDSETADYEAFNKALIDHLSPDRTPQQRPSHPAKQSKKWEGYYIPIITRIKPFELFDIMGSHVRVLQGQDGLLLIPFQKKQIVLSTIDNRLFRTDEKVGASHLFYEDKLGQKYLTTGILTLKKVNGLKIALLITGCLSGVLAMITLICYGVYHIFKKLSHFFARPIFPSFIGVSLITVIGVLLSFNDVTQIGNKNFLTIIFYCSTIILPIGLLISFFLSFKTKEKGLEFLLLLFIIQFTIILWSYNVIPFAIWR
ncbi:serine hydrolase domain-containing protein [Sphingobacterium thalpophilum]|uniref:Serine hydrolase domain-containing protein n=1 Tax=Sphingobacterium thalpophilum TaxID=259 RepID=A0ABV4HBZ9_9SPHI